MSMDPLVFYESFVLPNYCDFCEEEDNVRKGFNAALSVSHMTDNYYNYYKRHNPDKVARFKNIKIFKTYLSKKISYFDDIQSLSNAHKHLYTYPDKSYVTVESGGVVTSITIQVGNILRIDGSESDDFEKTVVIYTRKDGTRVKLKAALIKVIDLWEKMLDRSL